MRSASLWKYSLATVVLLWGVGNSLLPQAQAAAPVCLNAEFIPPSVPTTVCCGDILTASKKVTDATFVLDCTADPHNPTLLVDGVTLDLNGHVVKCATSQGGIVLFGTAATLTSGAATNGEVTNCFDGVSLIGTGAHLVSFITSQNNFNDGFFVTSLSRPNTLTNNSADSNSNVGFEVETDKNTLHNNRSILNNFGFLISGSGNILTDNVGSFNNFDGFLIANDQNRLLGNVAYNNGDDGFNIEAKETLLTNGVASSNAGEGFYIGDDKNKMTGNTADDNGGDGFLVQGFKNKLINNEANGNTDSGIELDESASNTTITGNFANDNLLIGFLIGGLGSNTLFLNTANNNARDGFLISSDRNTLKFNTANINKHDNGIVVSGSNNKIMQNTATDNGDYDLQDNNAFCDSNRWNDNTFGTSNYTPPVSANCIN